MSLDLSSFVGRQSPITEAPDKVSKSDLRHWREVIAEDTTPFWETDWEATAADPAMLMSWAMPPLWTSTPGEPGPQDALFDALAEAGFDGRIGVGLQQETFAPVKVGDRLRYSVTVEAVSPSEVITKAGRGYLVDLAYEFHNGRGEKVAVTRYSVLAFNRLTAGQ